MGLPILTSIIECNKVRKKGVWIIADGGIRSTGDIAKAIYFGADFCMIGKLLASTNLATGTCYNKDLKEIPKGLAICDKKQFENAVADLWKAKYNKEQEQYNAAYTETSKHIIAYKSYHGMASRQARENILSYAGVEGAEGLIRYSGTTFDFIADTILRLQSALSYAGARNWTEFRKKTKAYRRSNSSIVAADVHLDILTRLH